MKKEKVTEVTSALGDKKLGVFWNVSKDEFRAQKFGKVDTVETFSSEKECKEFITGKKIKTEAKKASKGGTKKMSTENYEKSKVNFKDLCRTMIKAGDTKDKITTELSNEYKKSGKTDDKWVMGRVKAIYSSMIKEAKGKAKK